MKIFVAGATGVIGSRLVPLLVADGHEVVGMSRSAERAKRLEASGARGVVCDVYDRRALRELLAGEHPNVVIHELTDLPHNLGPSGSDAEFAANRRIRTEGTRILVDAARAAGARRVIAQSYVHVYAASGDWIKSEIDSLDLEPGVPAARRRNVEAIQALERAVLETPGIEGVALRYGTLYGPGTAYVSDGSIARLVRQRHFPIVGDGRGMTSFIHVDDAAAATIKALSGPTGVYNIVDDEPAPRSGWAPFYAETLGAPAPRHVPAWLIRVLGREHFAYRATEQRGASNAKAKRDLGLDLRYRSWRDGFSAESSRRAAAEPGRRAAA
jgi:nucleoside-diphosphate-sugar epimerase